MFRISSKPSELKKLSLVIDGDCRLCHHVAETIDHLFKQCDLEKSVWLSIKVSFPNPKNFELYFVDQLEHIWTNKSWNNKIFGNLSEKVIHVALAMWNHKNNVIF